MYSHMRPTALWGGFQVLSLVYCPRFHSSVDSSGDVVILTVDQMQEFILP